MEAHKLSLKQLSLFPLSETPPFLRLDPKDLTRELRSFSEFGKETVEMATEVSLPGQETLRAPTFVNEFWTSKQRAAHSLHEVSYRACFKPQLPRFFIERLTLPGQVVYDPFMGRGTTVLEAGLLGRRPVGCDVNPLSALMVGPRLSPPELAHIAQRLQEIDLGEGDEFPEELLVFYHADTLKQICALKKYLLQRQQQGSFDELDAWIRMVALNRLTGHSSGFFSVYTMPPNQAVSVEVQRKINLKRDQTPPRREVARIILRKTVSLLADGDAASKTCLDAIAPFALLLSKDAEDTPEIPKESVHLAVTSPPFLDVVDYAADNWLRCWFAGIEAAKVQISIIKKVEDWQAKMGRVFAELRRMLVPGGFVAFEVGEVRGGKILLEEAVIRAAAGAGLEPVLVLINSQQFTKTANCWGVDNNLKGTNTNRIVLLRKAGDS